MRFLVVDDEQTIRNGLMQFILARKYGDVSVASSGSQALDMASTDCPDIILLDIVMPGINGLQIVQLLQEMVENVVIIIISGYNETIYLKKAIQCGIVLIIFSSQSILTNWIRPYIRP